MALIIVLSLLVCLLGLIIYFICLGLTKGTAGEIGKIMFAFGLLAFLLSGAQLGSCATVTTNGGGVHR